MIFKVLIVEDDFMVADCLEETLKDAGYDVCGVAGNIADAIRLGEEHNPDLGVIDLRLANKEFGTAIALALRRRGPFGVLFATGNPDNELIDHVDGEGCIAKPYSDKAIVAALGIVQERMAGAAVLSAFPHGFRLL
jgi:two-component system, response regulator PdtaR